MGYAELPGGLLCTQRVGLCLFLLRVVGEYPAMSGDMQPTEPARFPIDTICAERTIETLNILVIVISFTKELF
jgi:hypothetical protein